MINVTSTVIGVAFGMLVLVLSVVWFASVWNSYVMNFAAGLRELADYMDYRSRALLRIVNASLVSDTSIEAYVENNGAVDILIDNSSIAIAVYFNASIERCDVGVYGRDWTVDRIIIGEISRTVVPGEPFSLEPGAVMHLVFNITRIPDANTSIRFVISDGKGVVATYVFQS